MQEFEKENAAIGAALKKMEADFNEVYFYCMITKITATRLYIFSSYKQSSDIDIVSYDNLPLFYVYILQLSKLKRRIESQLAKKLIELKVSGENITKTRQRVR